MLRVLTRGARGSLALPRRISPLILVRVQCVGSGPANPTAFAAARRRRCEGRAVGAAGTRLVVCRLRRSTRCWLPVEPRRRLAADAAAVVAFAVALRVAEFIRSGVFP